MGLCPEPGKVTNRLGPLLDLSPKSFARTVRFVKVYQQLVTGQGNDLLALVITHGYYDQTHFTKEFRCFTHHTPTQRDAFRAPNLHQNARQWEVWN